MAQGREIIRTVILDLDQTLTEDQGSWLQFTSLIGADVEAHKELFERYKNNEIPYPDAKRELIEGIWRKSHSLDRKGIEDVFKKIEYRDDARDAVEYLNSKYRLCLISGAIDIFVKQKAKELSIPDYFASTKFMFDENDLLTDFKYTLDRGEVKVKYFDIFCEKNDIDPQECAAIGDGESDMPIFDKVGLPILFVASETTEEQKGQISDQFQKWEDIENIL